MFGSDRSDDGLPVYDFRVCAVEPPPLVTDAGYTISTQYGVEELADADLIAIPAWSTGHEAPAELLDALRERRRAGRTGDERVHRGVRPRRRRACSTADARRRTGATRPSWPGATPPSTSTPTCCTSTRAQCSPAPGTAAGIDLCLHILREEHGAAVANAVARRMVVPPHRDGGQAQYIEAPMVVHDRGDDLAVVLDWVQAHLNQPFGVEHLARRANMSLRTFNRRFTATTGTAPHRWLIAQRVALAQRLLEETDLDVEQVADQTGFGTAATLRQHFARLPRHLPAGVPAQLLRRHTRREVPSNRLTVYAG